MAYLKRTRDQHFDVDGPKRILALDGGGLRGILTLGILESIEDELRRRNGNHDAFRLCDYFDLIAGTSTGAIIAAALAIGWSVDEITTRSLRARVPCVPAQSPAARADAREVPGAAHRGAEGGVRARHHPWQRPAADRAAGGDQAARLRESMACEQQSERQVFPVTSRRHDRQRRLQAVAAVRASTAAPDYFDPERITIAQLPNHPPISGDFVDGGVSPFNNPALQAFMYATLGGYRLNWPAGEDNILLVSVGHRRRPIRRCADRKWRRRSVPGAALADGRCRGVSRDDPAVDVARVPRRERSTASLARSRGRSDRRRAAADLLSLRRGSAAGVDTQVLLGRKRTPRGREPHRDGCAGEHAVRSIGLAIVAGRTPKVQSAHFPCTFDLR